LRAELERVCREASEWDQRVAILQVVDTNERAMQLRALVSAPDASKAWDLRCRVREALIDFLQRSHAAALPRLRAELDDGEKRTPVTTAAGTTPARAGKGDSSAIKEPTQPGVHARGDARAPSDGRNDISGKGA
jgi:hypothetical protein